MAMIQYPIYGAVIGFFTTSSKGTLRIAVGVLLLTHFLAFLAGFVLDGVGI